MLQFGVGQTNLDSCLTTLGYYNYNRLRLRRQSVKMNRLQHTFFVVFAQNSAIRHSACKTGRTLLESFHIAERNSVSVVRLQIINKL